MTSKKNAGCVLCQKIANKNDSSDLVLWRNLHSIVLLNLYPYNNGHLMICPSRHLASLKLLTRPESMTIHILLAESERILRDVFNPDGFNIGINLGKCAGAGIEDHLHWHIVPRWDGDTNYMPVLGETKVLPQSLEQTYQILKPHFVNINPIV